MAEDDLLALQVSPAAIRPSSTQVGSDLLLTPVRMPDRLRHFPEDVYDLTAESHLSRFVKVLLGDAGAGQLRKRLMLQRLQSTLQGTHFFDLDRFYGPLFGLRRSPNETLDLDPFTETATRERWDATFAKDASFRSRIEQFSRALAFGPTPTGMELLSEALLSVDCDIYESFLQADASYQTYAELEHLYADEGTYADMEGVSYGLLEGEALQRLSGDERRVFIVRPKRRITLSEAYDLRRVLSRLKPADSRFTIDFTGIPLHAPLPIGGVTASSEHWEVIPKVSTSLTLSPYQHTSGVPVEQPRPPFAGYQGEAWSYVPDLKGVIPYSLIDGTPVQMPAARTTFDDGSYLDFSSAQAMLPKNLIQAGRAVSDAIMVVHPYTGPRGVPHLIQGTYVTSANAVSISKLYSDGIPIEALRKLLGTLPDVDPFQQNPQHRYWVTPERWMDDPAEEVLEVRLSNSRLVNYLSFEASLFPHQVIAEVHDDESGEWEQVMSWTNTESVPRNLPSMREVTRKDGHPMHSHPNHWEKVGTRIPPVETKRVRLRLRRVEGDPPLLPSNTMGPDQRRESAPVPYSLGIRGFDVGYRITSRADFPSEGNLVGVTSDIAGSRVQFEVHEHTADLALDGEMTGWRSEPQPVNYAVVNLYLDMRGPDHGDGTVVDRFYLDPTHAGPHFNIYYSNDPQESDGTDAFYEERSWTPIARDYTLQKGYVHLPPTRARYFKFEFTGLVAEPYETLLPITRKVKLFPQYLVEAMHRAYGHPEEALPPGQRPAVDVAREEHYRDALQALIEGSDERGHRSTEALYISSLGEQERMRGQSWVFSFTPWHQQTQAPRFYMRGRHVYEEVEVRHSTKVAFFVGLRTIEAYRTKWEEDDDATVYFDTYDDFRNLSPGFTWAFEPGFLTSQGTDVAEVPIEAVSRTFSSLHNVTALQFATEQSNAVQLVPDDDFRDPRLADYKWDDPDFFMRVGDAQLVYSAQDNTVLNLRYVIPPTRPLDGGGNIVKVIPHPVFSFRPFEVTDDAAAQATEGGLATPRVLLSPAGRAYGAARFTLLTDLTTPLYLQLIDANTEEVLVEKALSGRQGETIEEYVPFDILEPETVVRVRLIQRGKSGDGWALDTLSLFDEGIVWEFSVNGGSDWYEAKGIRNNEHGILTFPEVGNQLRYRVRCFRPRMWVSAIKMRPHYVGTKNARPTGTHRGPNLSYYDHDVPIYDDPMFTSWKKPIPYWWFAVSRTFPILPIDGAPNITEFARFYGRPVSESVPEPTDFAEGVVFARRFAVDWIPMEGDWATRPLPLDWRVHNAIQRPVGQGVATRYST